ncbi:hypothetical protein Tco_0502493 [Tanacetum coccineum]
MPHDSPLLGGHTSGSDEGSMTLHELTVLCTKLSNKVDSLETELKQTKQTYGAAFTKLIKKVKMLEQTVKTGQARRRSKIVGSDDEEDEEDPSKQGRSLIKEMDLDVGISLVHPHAEVHNEQNLDSTAAQVSTASTFKLHEEEQARFNAKQEAKFDAEVAQKLQEEFDAAERQRMAQVHQAAQGFTDAEWDDVLARVAADEDFIQQLQAGEKCSEEDLPMKLVELVNQRKKFFAQQRAEAKRNKPMTLAQQKKYMSNYIKNQEGGYSIKQLKSLSFEQVKEIFETTMRRVQSFVPMGSELEVQRLKRASQEVLEEYVKRQKTREASGLGEEQLADKEKKLSEEELQKLLVIVPVEEVYVEALQVKYPIIHWEIYSEDTRRSSTAEPTDDKEKALWVKLKRLFEPDNDDTLWKLQRYMHDPLVWKLYDTCGVYHVSLVRGHDIFMLVEKEYPLTRGLLTLMLANKLQVDEYSEMGNELLRKIFILANRPRQ